MNQAQLKVLAKVLGSASDEFSHHGCNDLCLDWLGLTPEELTSFKEGFTKFLKADDPLYVNEGNCVQDWLVMSYLKEVALREVKDNASSSISPP